VAVAAAGTAVPATASAGVGALDPTFGNGGAVLTQLDSTGSTQTEGAGLAVAPNGDIYQAGTIGVSSPEVFVARFLPNGSPDHSFGVDGVVTEAFATGGGQVVVLPSGNVIVSGLATPNEIAIAEYTPSGGLDTSFAHSSSTPGVFFEDPMIPNEQQLTDVGVAVQSDGKLVLGFDVGTGSSPSSITGNLGLVQRLGAKGTVDTGFASGGTYTLPVPPGSPAGTQVDLNGVPIVDSAGDIVFAEAVGNTMTAPTTAMTLGSLSSAGVPNAGFPASVKAAPVSEALAVIQAANGDFVMVGEGDVGGISSSSEQWAAAAVKPSGAPDTAFGGKGTGWVRFGPTSGGQIATDLVQQADGRFVVTGVSIGVLESTVVGRLLGNGTVDPSFGVGGVLSPPLSGESVSTNAALSADHQLLLSGLAITTNGMAITGGEALLAKLTLDTPPSLAFTFAPAAPVVGQPVDFTAAAIASSSRPTVKWDLGSGSFTDATGVTATKTFDTPGRYTIRARATDDDGEATIEKQTLTIGAAPAPPGGSCSSSLRPTTKVKSKLLLPEGLLLAGSSAAHCPSTVKSVGVAIARVKGKECGFLSTRHRWGNYGSCTPKAYLPASGTYSWAFALKLKFARGTYWLWERAVDNKGIATANTASSHVTLRAAG
jgi:uncharacterized delta-60 repeat protein